MRSSRYGLGLAIAAACMTFGAGAANAATTKVLPSDVDAANTAPTKSWSYGESTASAVTGFQTGPKTTPMGGGSLQLNTGTDLPSRAQIFTNKLTGTKLADIDGLGYSTFRKPSSTGLAFNLPSIQVRIDLDGNPATTGVNGVKTLVFEPYSDQGNNAVETNTWQEWDAYDQGAATFWVPSNTGTVLDACDDNTGRANRCSIAQIKQLAPNAVLSGFGGYNFGVNLGTYQTNTNSNVDALYLSANGVQSTFDFEEARDPGDQGPAGNNGTDGTNGTQGAAGATGPQGPQGTAGTQGTSGVTPSSTPTTGKVSLVSKSLKVAKKTRKVSVSISCPRTNGLCEGRLSLVLKGKTIGRTNFQVRGGRSGKAIVTLSKKRYAALKKSQKLQVNVFSRDLAGTASSASKSLTLTK